MATAFIVLCWLPVFANFSGYILLLWVMKALRPRSSLDERKLAETDRDQFTIIIPVYNEAAILEKKLVNTLSLSYDPSKVKIIVVDGGSSDSSLAIANEVQNRYPSRNIETFQAHTKGKINQLNDALSRVPDDSIIVVSDADATIKNLDALKQVETLFLTDQSIGLVGGWTTPPLAPHTFTAQAEHAYWDKQNRFRYIESIAFSSSIVVAPFYAFRKGLISNFPTDCVADDVYISFEAHLQGYRIVYWPGVEIVEQRYPLTLKELFEHKLRKTHAFSMELLRVTYRLPYMGKRLKAFYAFKIFQFYYLPWACSAFILMSLWLLVLGRFCFLFYSYGFLLALILLASLSMSPPAHRSRGGFSMKAITSSIVIFAIMIAVLLINFFAFPFVQQDSSYKRLKTLQ